MAVIDRLTHPDDLWPGTRIRFGLSYKEHPPEWSRIYEKLSSEKAQERVQALTGFGYARAKAEGSSVSYDTDGQGPTTIFTPTVYTLGYIVTREMVDDGLYKEVSGQRARALGRSMRVTAETVHANVLNRGFNGAYPVGNGQPLFSAAHPSRNGPYSNLLTAADFSEAALEDSMKVASRMVDDRGLPLAAKAWRLIGGSDYEFDFDRILNSTGMPGTANNDINPVRGKLGGGYVINHFLTDFDAWFIQLDIDNGLLSFWRDEPELKKGDDFDTENLKAFSRMRFSCGVGDPRALLGNPGA